MTHTTDSPAVSVIVPVYNEEENVPILQAELRAALKAIDHEFIFVDDGSADHTVERIEPAPNLRVIRFEKNAGQSAAMYAGLQAARGAIVVLIDGDLQNDPADIPKLVDEISRGADLAAGAPWSTSGPSRSRRPTGHTAPGCTGSGCAGPDLTGGKNPQRWSPLDPAHAWRLAWASGPA